MDRESIFKFIERYKYHTCLWDVSSPDYTKKNKRMTALYDLVPLLGESATVDTVRKKIEILRNGYKRELKKVYASFSTGSSASDIYTPTLWYYEQMSFLSSQEGSRTGVEYIQEQSQDTESDNENSKSEQSAITERRTLPYTITQDELIDTGDKDGAFGTYLNQQLQAVDNNQRFIAEKLMSDVLYLARTNKLNDTSTVITSKSSQISET